jgi:glutamine cyclotransferase
MSRIIIYIFLFAILSAGNISCSEQQQEKPQTNFKNVETTVKNKKRIELYKPEIIRKFEHDKRAFTQGLCIYNGFLLESTGQRGESSLRKIDLFTGNIINKKDIAAKYFGEGITVLNNKLYFLTWTSQVCLIFDPDTFEEIDSFTYFSQGWGLTDDTKSLIMSDGSSYIRFFNPEDFLVERTLFVKLNGKPVQNLNELEYVNNKIYANIWGKDYLYIIDPDSGEVEGKIDLSELRPLGAVNPEAEVLNGIAYNNESDTFIVTGKNWDYYFEIKLNKVQ